MTEDAAYQPRAQRSRATPGTRVRNRVREMTYLDPELDAKARRRCRAAKLSMSAYLAALVRADVGNAASTVDSERSSS